MATLELAPGIKPDEARKAFEMIRAEMERVRPLNYRAPLFTKWKPIVAGALARFLGPDHPDAVAFGALVFHGPMPKSPMDPPVSQKDIDAFAAAMTATAALLDRLLAALAPEPPAPPPLAAASAPVPAARPVQPPLPGVFSPPAGGDAFKVTRGSAGEVARFAASAGPLTTPPPPAAASQDLSRHAGGIPEGGLKIVSRSGVSAPSSTMDGYIEATTDPEEKALLVAIKTMMDDPATSWEQAKHLLAELWWLRREAVTKLLPIILRR